VRIYQSFVSDGLLIINQHGMQNEGEKGMSEKHISQNQNGSHPRPEGGPGAQSVAPSNLRRGHCNGTEPSALNPKATSPLQSAIITLFKTGHVLSALRLAILVPKTKLKFALLIVKNVITSPFTKLFQSMLCRCNAHRFVHINPAGVGLCSGCEGLFYTANGEAFAKIDERKRDRRTRRNVMKGLK